MESRDAKYLLKQPFKRWLSYFLFLGAGPFLHRRLKKTENGFRNRFSYSTLDLGEAKSLEIKVILLSRDGALNRPSDTIYYLEVVGSGQSHYVKAAPLRRDEKWNVTSIYKRLLRDESTHIGLLSRKISDIFEGNPGQFNPSDA